MEENIVNALGNVLIVGGGRMGRAIASGLLDIDGISPDRITVANPGLEKRHAIASELKVATVASASEGLPADTIVLAVKPAKIGEVCSELVCAGFDRSALVISVAAGISTVTLNDHLGEGVSVVRVMPNTPLLCGFGMSAVSPGASCAPEECELVRSIFASMGRAVVVDESEQDAVCAISGSGPAYYELFCETIARTGQELGLSYETALELSLQTMLGTAELITRTGQDLQDAIDAVSSPGGTTVAALETMRSHDLQLAISQGVKAAAQRSKELGS